jgi:hypothetical protein
MKYIVLSSSTLTELEDQVNNHLGRGYELVGGVSVSPSDKYYVPLYAQAVIKK